MTLSTDTIREGEREREREREREEREKERVWVETHTCIQRYRE